MELHPLSYGEAFGPVGAYLEQVTRHKIYACQLLHTALRQKYPQLNDCTAVLKTANRHYTIFVGIGDSIPVKHPASKPGIRARLWRVLGELTGRTSWLVRGKTTYTNLIASNPVLFPVEWQGFQAIDQTYPPESVLIRFYAAYDPLHDQLIILE